jgi:hypothetical protein
VKEERSDAFHTYPATDSGAQPYNFRLSVAYGVMQGLIKHKRSQWGSRGVSEGVGLLLLVGLEDSCKSWQGRITSSGSSGKTEVENHASPMLHPGAVTSQGLVTRRCMQILARQDHFGRISGKTEVENHASPILHPGAVELEAAMLAGLDILSPRSELSPIHLASLQRASCALYLVFGSI